MLRKALGLQLSIKLALERGLRYRLRYARLVCHSGFLRLVFLDLLRKVQKRMMKTKTIQTEHRHPISLELRQRYDCSRWLMLALRSISVSSPPSSPHQRAPSQPLMDHSRLCDLP